MSSQHQSAVLRHPLELASVACILFEPVSALKHAAESSATSKGSISDILGSSDNSLWKCFLNNNKKKNNQKKTHTQKRKKIENSDLKGDQALNLDETSWESFNLLIKMISEGQPRGILNDCVPLPLMSVAK